MAAESFDSPAVHLSENAVGYPFRPLSGGDYNKCFPANARLRHLHKNKKTDGKTKRFVASQL